MSKRKLPEPEEVERLYWEEKMTLREVGEEYGVTHNAVLQYMVRHGIPRRSRKQTYTSGSKHHNWVDGDDILDDLIAGYLCLGMWPRVLEYRDYGSYSVGVVWLKFGKWDNAIKAAKERYEQTKEITG